jgi:hypothetical protein
MLIKTDPAKAQALADAKRVEELRALLASTDYKVLPDYDRTTDDVIAQRQAWRNEIRSLLDEQDNEAT